MRTPDPRARRAAAIIAAVFATAMSVASCGGAVRSTAVPSTAVPSTAVPSVDVTPTGPAAPARLAGTGWKAVTVDGRPVVVGSEPTAIFSAQEVSGTTGCNSYGGSYTFSNGAITFGPLRTTLMACIGPVGEIEQKFNAALAGATSVAVDGDGHLVIDGTGGSIVLAGTGVTAPA